MLKLLYNDGCFWSEPCIHGLKDKCYVIYAIIKDGCLSSIKFKDINYKNFKNTELEKCFMENIKMLIYKIEPAMLLD